MTALLVRSPVGSRRLDPGQRLVLGREADVTISDSRVSRHHVELYFAEGRWVLRDLDSRNGTFSGYDRITAINITEPCSIRLGNPENGPLVELQPQHQGAGHAQQAYPAPTPAPPGYSPPGQTPPPGRAPAAPTPAPPGPGYPSAPGGHGVPAGHGVPGHGPGAGHHAPPGRTPAPAAPRPESLMTQMGPASSRPAAPPRPPGQRPPQRVLPLGEIFRIGRSPENELALPDDLLTSRHHAEIRRTPDGVRLRDLRSRNGTYVNGHRVADAFLRPGDLVSVGHHQLVFHGDRIAVFSDDGEVSLHAQELSVYYGDVLALDRLSLKLDERSLLGVVGPSGGGKSTLLGALTGMRPADYGRMVYEGRDLYANYDDLRHRIGLVPQDDILHKELTVEKALKYAASLRFPEDVSKAERQHRIEEVMHQLDLTERRDLRISKLSGGQRKRTSVALELLTKPSLLFLDEPTSGLDPSLDKEVMNTLRTLADDGRTVVVVTHSVLHLDVCDRVLVLCRGGKVGYYGPPDQLLGFFGVQDYSDVFKMVSDQPDYWQDRFRRSRFYAEYCAPDAETAAEQAQQAMRPHPMPPKQSGMKQFAILARRMLSVVAADKLTAISVVGLPIVLAGIALIVSGDNGLAPPNRLQSAQGKSGILLIVLVFGASLLGLISAIREIVKEGAIYRRERTAGLSPVAYLLSKMFVLGCINVLQAIIFVNLSLWYGRPDDGVVVGSGTFEIIAMVSVTAFACTALALMISALVKTNEQAMMIMVVLIMSMLIFMGKLIEVAGQAGLEQLAWLFPTRWGYAAGASTIDLRNIERTFEDSLWDHTTGTWFLDMGILVTMIVVFAVVARFALRKYEGSDR